jgi:hypothetical protein
MTVKVRQATDEKKQVHHYDPTTPTLTVSSPSYDGMASCTLAGNGTNTLNAYGTVSPPGSVVTACWVDQNGQSFYPAGGVSNSSGNWNCNFQGLTPGIQATFYIEFKNGPRATRIASDFTCPTINVAAAKS